MTGRRIGELHYVRGHQFLEEWLHRLATLEPNHISPISYHLLDPNMASESPDFPYQLQAMARAASLCLRRDPDFRPSMSKVRSLFLSVQKLVSFVLVPECIF